MTTRTAVDWEAVEKAFRAGVRSLRDIGAEFGCSHTAIRAKAKENGWDRDLSAKIKARADAKLSKEALSKEVSTESEVSEREIVEANAELQAGIIRAHRKDITRSRAVAMSLLAELEHQTNNRELYEQLGELMLAPDEKGIDKLNELYHKAISLGGRTGTMKQLSDTLRTMIGLEREAFGIDEKNGAGANAIESLLKELEARNA